MVRYEGAEVVAIAIRGHAKQVANSAVSRTATFQLPIWRRRSLLQENFSRLGSPPRSKVARGRVIQLRSRT